MDTIQMFNNFNKTGNNSIGDLEIDPNDFSLLETLSYWPHQVILTTLYTIVAIASFTFNLVTIVVLVKYDNISSELYLYLINLSIADIMMSLFCIPYTYTNFILNRWVFPAFLCPVGTFVQTCSVFVSIWTLTIIGIDRYHAICNPMDTNNKCWLFPCRSSKYANKLMAVLLVWVLAIISGSIEAAYTFVLPFKYGSTTLYDCREVIPKEYSKWYTLYLFVSTFGLPMVILIYVYSIIGYNIWKHVMPGNPHQHRDINNNLTRERIIKILILILCLFALCWFPLQVFSLLVEFAHNFLLFESPHDYRMFVYGYLVAHFLAMFHSLVNPIIYCWISRNFKHNFCNFTHNVFVCVTQACHNLFYGYRSSASNNIALSQRTGTTTQMIVLGPKPSNSSPKIFVSSI